MKLVGLKLGLLTVRVETIVPSENFNAPTPFDNENNKLFGTRYCVVLTAPSLTTAGRRVLISEVKSASRQELFLICC